jgi:tRNA pseudouridine32 synthase / 23S rRNA pseudouridine746 synthase
LPTMEKPTNLALFHPLLLHENDVKAVRLRSPFAATPHELAQEAARQLQEKMAHMEAVQNGAFLGKMYGVLVVQNKENQVGYLAAFSGKLGDTMQHEGFVPPVFDVHDLDGFFKAGESELNQLTKHILLLENNPLFVEKKNQFLAIERTLLQGISQEKERAKVAKANRDSRRAVAKTGNMQIIENELVIESQRDHFTLRDLKNQWKSTLLTHQNELSSWQSEITEYREIRAQKSAHLQQKIFEEYTFLNSQKKRKSLKEIFQIFSVTTPPAGAGECAGPKLFQYAFLHDYKPLALAEFWWGAASEDEVRKHGNFYPACRGKCAPILAHMLDGLELEIQENAPPLLQTQILFEDEFIAIALKPAGLLSVPGKEESESVQMQMKRRYPDATGPLVVHRLDQATSGLMLVAKTEEAYKLLQKQFLNRGIKKRYTAILEGNIAENEGVITLPLRVDLDDRPRQMVCETHGKSARTEYFVLEQWGSGCRIQFKPITGRTHQLRVHAAHALGLNTPIKGDDLYGTPSDRLYLHAEWLQFVHPVTNEVMEWESRAEF